MGEIDEDVEVLKQHGILVDRDDEGYNYSFSQSQLQIVQRYFSIIERHGAQSFGKGNFKALFEAIERSKNKEEHYKFQ